jgi:NADH dehydrogenase [ubiquinone] 1 alpha subcomplex assembly factor 6
VADQLSYCGELVRNGDHDRFLTALFAAGPAREHLFALYAFNLEIARIRDMVSEPLLGEIRLQWWREGIEAVYSGQGVRAHPVLQGLDVTIQQCGLPRMPFDILIDAHAGDFEMSPPVSMAAMESYADATSAGLMRLALGLTGGGVPDATVRHAGLAWGLTGLLRTIGFYAAKRRTFLPADLMQAEGLSAEDVYAYRRSPALRRVILALAGQAQLHLDAVGRVLPRPSRQALPALLPVTLARAYLKQIARSDYDPFAVQAPIPAFRRQSRLIWAMARRRL